MVMYISQIYGGPELVGSAFDRALALVTRLRGPADEPGRDASLDMVFHVPGSQLSPDYDGVRTGRLSKRQRMLQVQIAVPPELLRRSEAEIVAFLLDSLRDGVRIAGPRFRRARIEYDEDAYLRTIERIRTSIVH